MFPRCILVVCLTFTAVLKSHADLMPPKVREPQFPLKTQRMLRTDAEIALARENVARYETAKGIANKITTRADAWVAWDDDALRNLITTADVPRAFNVGTSGCPECGQEIYAKGGTYPWIIDPKVPFKVKCPVDGSMYPSNDYGAYYAGGLQDATLLTGDFSDSGRGWIGPDGQANWFVAYANHWTWQNHIFPALQYLSRAYLLTGDTVYADKAIIMLDRIAEVYPNMDYHPQSRYGQLQENNGGRYEGKIVNNIWETRTLTGLAEAYDFVWEAIDDESVAGKSGEAVRANIEANILEEGIEAYFSGKVRGNFGMHQKALVYAGLARQFGKQQEWFDGLLNDGQSIDSMTGLNYALYNLVYRDGPPYETSPGYNFSWVVNITTVAEALKRADYDVYAIQKMRRLYDGVLDIVNIGKYTPALGDSGAPNGGLIGNHPFVYQSAWRAYEDPRYRDHLQSFNATGENGIRDFESLFSPVVEAAKSVETPVRSRLMDGYGMAILNNPSNTISLALYYGYKGGHGHYDRLHFSFFANGEVMMPDLGYPDFMNAYVPGIFTWSKNTIAHNTVTVDAGRQRNNRPGTVNLFVDEGFARALDIDAAETYPQTSEYRRRMLLIDTTESRGYAIDYFTVAGGSQHDYSLHGTPGTFNALDGTWSDAAPGTLAGEDVALGTIYDDARIAPADFTGSYADYKGSGFQHLQNVRRLQDGSANGVWTHTRNEAAKVQIHVLSGAHETIHAQAQISPVKQKTLVDYLIARRTGPDLRSQFLSIIEPYEAGPQIQSQRALGLSEGNGTAIEVHWKGEGDPLFRDVIFINNGEGTLRVAGDDLHTDAAMAILRFEGETLVHRWFTGGSYVSVHGQRTTHQMPLSGVVTRVDPEAGAVYIKGHGATDALAKLAGQRVFFENGFRRTAHPIQRVETTDEGYVLFVDDDLHVGRIRNAAVSETGITTATGLSFAPVYDGTYLFDMTYQHHIPLRELSRGTANFAKAQADTTAFVSGEDSWIVNVGPGDRIEVLPVTVE